MNAFIDRKLEVFDQLRAAQRHYMDAYDEIQKMLDAGLIEQNDYKRIIRIYLDAGDALMNGVQNVRDVFDEIEHRMSNSHLEVKK
jgi:thiaminase